jgi:hypothetical protein
VLLYVAGFTLSRLTLRQIDRADPNVPITPSERQLRRIYGALINLAGVYYYISLPVVAVLVVAIAGGLIYAFLAIGTVPIKLTVLLVIGSIATVWSMGRSLFLRVKTEDPGRPLTREEAPELWALAERVAQTVNTRAVDEIRLTTGTDLCVYERGSWRTRMANKATRVLVLGAAVLRDFRQQDFLAVLAHEYGHFSNRDTAGGAVALRVQGDIWKFYLAMRNAGQATWLNIAFHFLRLYHLIFRRISHGATRLQEVLADRVAAAAYGAAAFEGGLKHAIRRSLEFDAHASSEIQAAIEAKRPVQNLYDSVPAQMPESVDQQFAAALNRDTTDDDTHPAPKDRFRLVSRVVASSSPAMNGFVWDLFRDPSAVQQEMMDLIEKRIASHRS